MAELNVCIFCGKEPEKPRQYGYQLTPRRNTCYCIDHSCDNGTLVSVHGYSGEEVVEKWNKIMPAADVEEVRHGRWIKTDPGNDTLFATCSQCNYPVDWWRGKTKYCPNCGAKMDLEDNQ